MVSARVPSTSSRTVSWGAMSPFHPVCPPASPRGVQARSRVSRSSASTIR
ncbi:hypothetical protein [Ornithinimicrobium kibberense]